MVLWARCHEVEDAAATRLRVDWRLDRGGFDMGACRAVADTGARRLRGETCSRFCASACYGSRADAADERFPDRSPSGRAARRHHRGHRPGNAAGSGCINDSSAINTASKCRRPARCHWTKSRSSRAGSIKAPHRQTARRAEPRRAHSTPHHRTGRRATIVELSRDVRPRLNRPRPTFTRGDHFWLGVAMRYEESTPNFL
jgi:hypothetical protein